MKNNIKFLLINILLALPHALITLLIDTGIMTGTSQTEYAYMTAVLVVYLVYTWVYAYIKEFIKFKLSKRDDISEFFDKLTNYVYVLVSMGSLFLFNRMRALGETGDAVAYTVAIFDVFFVHFKIKWINESWFFKDLLFQERFANTEMMKEEKKKQIKAARYGLIAGALSLLILLLSRFVIFNFVTIKMGDAEFGIFAAIVATIVLHGIYVEVFNKDNFSKMQKNRNVNIQYYWRIVDIAENGFKVGAMFSYLIALLLMKFNVVLAIFIALAVKWVSQYKLWGGSDPEYVPSGSYSFDDNKKETEKKPEFTYRTGYVKDKFGNIVGKTESYGYNDKYGGFETTEYKDNFGNVKGKSDTYKF